MSNLNTFSRLGWAFGSIRSTNPRASTSRLPIPKRHRTFASRPQSPSQAELRNNPFYIPPPGPGDIPPISARLRPLVPFLLYWTALTSLAFHLMQVRTHTKEDLARKDAQMTVLENIIDKYKRSMEQSIRIDEDEVERELQMVGLRERTRPDLLSKTGKDGQENPLVEEFIEGRSVTWKEVLFGRKTAKLTEEEQEDVAKAEWQEVINAASTHATPPSSTPRRDYSNLDSSVPGLASASANQSRPRAPSSAVYM